MTARPRRLAVATPLFAEPGLGLAVGMVGTMRAARSSDAAGAAFALVSQLVAMPMIFLRIIGAGIGVVVARALGGGRRDEADAVARATLGASSAVAGLAAAPLLGLLNAPPEVLPLAAPLLQPLAPAVLLDAWVAAMAGVLRAHLRLRDTLAVVIVMHAIHLALALLPMPGMGLAGCALALAASRVVAVALLPGRFTADGAIVAAGATLPWWTVLLEPGRTFNLVVVDALRATGDARHPVAAGALSFAVLLAGGSWLLGHVLGLGLVGVWLAYIADEGVRGLPMWRRWATHGGVPHARAARRRLRRRAARSPAPRPTAPPRYR